MHIIHISNGDFTSHLTGQLLGEENYPHFTQKIQNFKNFFDVSVHVILEIFDLIRAST
jgi:hypothetical protein